MPARFAQTGAHRPARADRRAQPGSTGCSSPMTAARRATRRRRRHRRRSAPV